MGNTILQPKTVVNIQNAALSVSNKPQKILMIGQKTAAGTATAGALDENIQNDNSWRTRYGIDSMLSNMVEAAKKENQVTIMDAISLDDAGGGVQATGAITVVGTATEDGTLEVIVGSEKNHKYDIAVTSGDTATVIGDAIDAAILADTQCPVTSVNTAGAVAITAVNDGTLGNDISLSISGTVAGVTHSVTVMSSGATDPTLTSIFDVVGENRYQTIVWPYAADTSVLRTFLDARFNVDNRVQDGIGVTCKQDSLSNHNTTLAALNSQNLVFIVDKLEAETSYAGSAQAELSPVKAAIFGAIRALRLTEDANISQYVITTNGPLDAFGGPAIASKPYFNTALPNLPVIKTGRGWADTEIEQLLTNGGSVLGQNSAGSSALMGEVVTTYKTDAAANPDDSFKFLNYVDTASNAREYMFNNLRARFAQSRLVGPGDIIHPGRDMANGLTIFTFCVKLYQDLSGPEYVLFRAGEDSLKFFKANLSVTLNLIEGKATVLMKTPLVVQMREQLATMQIVFSTEG
jgi:phage tail sheath gpL-like